MKILGQHSMSIEVPPVAGLDTDFVGPVLDAHSDELGLATIVIRAEDLTRQPFTTATLFCQARLEWGGEGNDQRIEFDILNGVVVTLAGKRWRVSVRNNGSSAVRIAASIAPGVRPAARELQVTRISGNIVPGSTGVFSVPAFAAWLEVMRTPEDTEIRVDFRATQAGAALWSVRALQGERLPRLPISNGAMHVAIANEGDDAAGDATVVPTLIWGLWI